MANLLSNRSWDLPISDWRWMKILFILLCSYAFIVPLFRFDANPYPEGLCHFLPCEYAGYLPVSIFLLCLYLFLASLYILEIRMPVTLGVFALLFIIVLSLERSNGIYHRKEIFSLILIGQWLAYVLPRNEMSSYNRAIQYSAGVIAACYGMAALTKLHDAGLGWITESPNIALQLIKVAEFKFHSSGDPAHLENGAYFSQWILSHRAGVQVLFAGALVLELFAFILLLNHRFAFYYGCALLVFHLVIKWMVNILLPPFALSELIFLVNVPGVLRQLRGGKD